MHAYLLVSDVTIAQVDFRLRLLRHALLLSLVEFFAHDVEHGQRTAFSLAGSRPVLEYSTRKMQKYTCLGGRLARGIYTEG